MASKNGTSNIKRHVASRTCLCSPTTHPGSFRCSLHRNPHKARSLSTARISPGRRELAHVAEFNWARVLLLEMIKPSSHGMRRSRNFRARPSRFCLMNELQES